MKEHLLDNPVWAALTTEHLSWAREQSGLRRYPADVAPFLAVERSGLVDPRGLEALVGAEQTVFLVGPRPEVTRDWLVDELGLLAQMVCDSPVESQPGPTIVALTEAHRPAVLELTALVYPHFFRPRAMELGRYFGILEQGLLQAMIGERMAVPGCREVSAVCTHPDFTGRGLARHLLIWLSNTLLAHHQLPFLHVSLTNERAKRLYERNGYRTRAEVPFWSVRRGPR